MNLGLLKAYILALGFKAGGGSVTAPLTLDAGTTAVSAPIIAETQTWNGAGVTFVGGKVNITDTASAAASLFKDYQIGGASKLAIRKDGSIIFYGNAALGSILLDPNNFGIIITSTNRNDFWFSSDSLRLSNAQILGWTGGTDAVAGRDTGITRVAAGVVGVGTGAAAATDGTLKLKNVVPVASTVANLTVAATAGAGARATVTDATATTFMSIVAGGGANIVPVFCNGTNWLIA